MADNHHKTLIDLIRHGEPEGGRAFRGHSIDDPLSEKGWQQMWHAVGDAAPWDHIITSPLIRCQAFAQALKDTDNIAYTTEDDFKEVGFGSWEGRTPDELKASKADEYDAFYNDPVHCRPPGSEELSAFIKRVTAAYDRVLERYNGQHILIVAHAGVIRALIANALHADPIGLYRIKVNNAGMSRLQHDHLGDHLLYHNVQLSNMAAK